MLTMDNTRKSIHAGAATPTQLKKVAAVLAEPDVDEMRQRLLTFGSLVPSAHA